LFKVRVCVTAAVVIQSKWRSWIASKHFRQLARGIISIQCLMRKRRASKYLLQLQMSELFGEVALHEMKAATTIALAWRRFCCQSQYKRNVEGKC
jgi:myosin heavy subunit